MKPQTQAIHTGVYVDKQFNAVTTPIYAASTFSFDAVGQCRGYDYTRTANPTRDALAENLAALEGGAGCQITCTGMSAILTVMHLVKPGDRVLANAELYGGAHRLFEQVLIPMGYDIQFIDMTDLAAVEAAATDDTKLIWIETPTNPLLNLCDIAGIVELAKRCGAITVADNTFCSPIFQKPLDMGVDIVVHSATKYINGHSDVVSGAIICKSAEHADRIAWLTNALGTGGSPFDAFLVLRGVKTLAMRMAQHDANGRAIAAFLQSQPQVKRVIYPGLESHRQHELARQQMTGFGGIVTMELDMPQYDEARSNKFFQALKLFKMAVSLGGVESLIEQPWSMSHAGMREQAKLDAGITPGIIRISAGIEDPDDLIDDLQRGLAAVS